MKRLITPYILLILLTTSPVLADSLIIETTINESLHVAFKFTTNEPQLYEQIKQQFNASTIPKILEENFEQQNLQNARVIYDLNQDTSDDDTNSIHAKFLLTGSDIINYTLSKTDTTRTFRVRTDWRKFQITLTQNLSLNLEEHFGAPITEWQQTNHRTDDGKIHPAFERTVEDPFEMTFRFILPENAVDIQTEEDTIIFKIPPAFEDTLLNSPLLILGALIIINIIAITYRKVKK
jgi:hypothetical protein